MKLPNINIAFSTQASNSIARSERGVVAIIVRDANAGGEHILTSPAQIPATLGVNNKNYIERAFLGYMNPPRKVIVYVLPADAANLTAALDYLRTQTFDYLVGPTDISTAECTAVVNWIKAQREAGFTPKTVLPDTAGNHEAIINFTTSGITDGLIDFTAAEYCSRIAGIIAGTPLTISCTYAALPEVADVDRLTKDDMDTAVNAGKFIVFYDGEKVKVGRGVNSLQTLTDDKGESFKKIKTVETIDMIRKDIKQTAQDNYIGKYANSYDNKCLLISAIKKYFMSLEDEGILASGTSIVEIDLEAQEAYLKSINKDTSNMTEQEIKTAVTADKVFLRANITILDAIEDIDLNITI
jgi:hypothetical protein